MLNSSDFPSNHYYCRDWAVVIPGVIFGRQKTNCFTDSQKISLKVDHVSEINHRQEGHYDYSQFNLLQASSRHWDGFSEAKIITKQNEANPKEVFLWMALKSMNARNQQRRFISYICICWLQVSSKYITSYSLCVCVYVFICVWQERKCMWFSEGNIRNILQLLSTVW